MKSERNKTIDFSAADGEKYLKKCKAAEAIMLYTPKSGSKRLFPN